MNQFEDVLADNITQKIKTLVKGYQYVVYTALYGDVDNLHDPIGTLSNNILFICFTDRLDVKSDVWTIIHDESNLDSRMAAKYWKFFGYKAFKENIKYTLWVDASIQIIDSILPLLDGISMKYPNSSILTFHHPKRSCVYSEIFWVFIMGKESIKSLFKTLVFLLKNQYSCGNGLIAGTVLVRKVQIDERNQLDNLMNEWWQCVKNYSTRDQLTFNFLASKKQFFGVHSFLDIAGNVFNCKYFKGVRIVRFDSKINPNSKVNLRHKFFYLILLLRNYFTK